MKNLKQVLPSGYGFDDVAVDLQNFRLEKGGKREPLHHARLMCSFT